MDQNVLGSWEFPEFPIDADGYVAYWLAISVPDVVLRQIRDAYAADTAGDPANSSRPAALYETYVRGLARLAQMTHYLGSLSDTDRDQVLNYEHIFHNGQRITVIAARDKYRLGRLRSAFLDLTRRDA